MNNYNMPKILLHLTSIWKILSNLAFKSKKKKKKKHIHMNKFKEATINTYSKKIPSFDVKMHLGKASKLALVQNC